LFFWLQHPSRSDHVIDAERRGAEFPKLDTCLRASVSHFGRDGIHEALHERRKIRVGGCAGVRQVLDKDVLARF
jgi:hypothetical protein